MSDAGNSHISAIRTRVLAVEEQLERADRRGRLRQFVQHSATLGAVVALGLLLIGLAAVAGWLTATWQALVLYALLIAPALVAWGILFLGVWATPARRDQLAAAVEAAQPALLDRLNTLTHLERTTPHSAWAIPIGQQAAGVLRAAPAAVPLTDRRVGLHMAGLMGLAALTAAVYWRYAPWQRLVAAEQAAQIAALQAPAETASLLIPPASSSSDPATASGEVEAWGEVRVSQPGYDLRALPIETIPLQIDAATNRELAEVRWLSSVNGNPPEPHALAPPSDPAYVTYQTELDLQLLQAQDWDVVGYYAEATTKDGTTYRSDLYFVEVFPAREDLEAIPGGEDGAAYYLLDEMASLIAAQQQVLQEQSRIERLAEGQAGDAEQRRSVLARAENALADATRRLDRQAAAEFDRHEQLQDMHERLKRSAAALEAAGRSLPEPSAPPADHPRQALRELVGARQELQRLLDQHPELFTAPELASEEDATEDPSPSLSAGEWARARDAATQLRQDQEQLLERPAQAEPSLSAEQRALAERVGRWPQEFPEAGQRVPEESAAAVAAAQRAGDQMQADPAQGRPAGQESASRLRELEREVAIQTERQRRQELRPLRREVGERMDQLTRLADQPEQFDKAQLREQADRGLQLADRLQQHAEQSPTPATELQRWLDAARKQSLDQACQQLAACQNDGEKRAAAGEARAGFQQAAEALEADNARSAANEHHQRLTQQLDQLHRREREREAARKFVKDSLQTQRQLQRQSAGNRQSPELASQQDALQQSFREHVARHAETMQQVSSQCTKAGDALGAASQAAAGGQNLEAAAEAAGNELQALDSALEQLQHEGQLADALRARELLDSHGEQLGRIHEQPGRFGQEQARDAGGDAQRLADEFRRLMQQPGMVPALRSAIARTLGTAGQRQLDAAAQRLAEAKEPAQRGAEAASVQQLLQRLAEGVRSSLRGGRQPGGDHLRERSHSALARGWRELDSLALGREKGRWSPDEERQLRREAATQFATGLPDVYGHNQRTQQVVQQLSSELTEKMTPVDRETVQELMSQVERLGREVGGETEQGKQVDEGTQMDPARLPPAYRQAIEKYFQRLSDEP